MSGNNKDLRSDFEHIKEAIEKNVPAEHSELRNRLIERVKTIIEEYEEEGEKE